MPDPAVVAAMDADAARLPHFPLDDVATAFRNSHARWRQLRRTEPERVRRIGERSAAATASTTAPTHPAHLHPTTSISALQAPASACTRSLARCVTTPHEGAWISRAVHIRHVQCNTRFHGRTAGVPPSWARRPGAPTDIRVLAAQYYGDLGTLGLEPGALRTWRRKLIAFPKTESVRPPYYGSFSRAR